MEEIQKTLKATPEKLPQIAMKNCLAERFKAAAIKAIDAEIRVPISEPGSFDRIF